MSLACPISFDVLINAKRSEESLEPGFEFCGEGGKAGVFKVDSTRSQ